MRWEIAFWGKNVSKPEFTIMYSSSEARIQIHLPISPSFAPESTHQSRSRASSEGPVEPQALVIENALLKPRQVLTVSWHTRRSQPGVGFCSADAREVLAATLYMSLFTEQSD